MTSAPGNPNSPNQERVQVTVYDLEGVAHKMSRANAVDNVQHLKWTFDPKPKSE